MTKVFCVTVDTLTKQCLGVDFFDTPEQMRRSASMFRQDSRPNCVVLEYPPPDREYCEALLSFTKGAK